MYRQGRGGCAGHKSYNEIDTISRTTSLDQVSLRPSFLTSAFSPRLDTNVPISSYTSEAYKQEPFPPIRRSSHLRPLDWNHRAGQQRPRSRRSVRIRVIQPRLLSWFEYTHDAHLDRMIHQLFPWLVGATRREASCQLSSPWIHEEIEIEERLGGGSLHRHWWTPFIHQAG